MVSFGQPLLHRETSSQKTNRQKQQQQQQQRKTTRGWWRESALPAPCWGSTTWEARSCCVDGGAGSLGWPLPWSFQPLYPLGSASSPAKWKQEHHLYITVQASLLQPLTGGCWFWCRWRWSRSEGVASGRGWCASSGSSEAPPWAPPSAVSHHVLTQGCTYCDTLWRRTLAYLWVMVFSFNLKLPSTSFYPPVTFFVVLFCFLPCFSTGMP